MPTASCSSGPRHVGISEVGSGSPVRTIAARARRRSAPFSAACCHFVAISRVEVGDGLLVGLEGMHVAEYVPDLPAVSGA